ncbi:MAG: serine protease [Pseudomonadota bacterium]
MSDGNEHAYDALIATAQSDLERYDYPDEDVAIDRLTGLRNFGAHDLVAKLAEKYTGHWPENDTIQKLYGQALIETGAPLGAAGFLGSVLLQDKADAAGRIELWALIGRAQKDLFQLAMTRGDIDVATRHAQASFDAYKTAYQYLPQTSYYPLINMAAVADLARANGIDLQGNPNPRTLAQEVLTVLEAAEKAGQSDRWIAATRAEAHIALNNWDAVEEHLKTYLGHGVTPFQHNGTLRQFRDLWRLGTRGGARGKAILTMLEAIGLQDNRFSGTVFGTAVSADFAAADAIPADSLEKMLGADGMVSFEWYKTGVKRAQSIAVVCESDFVRCGTAFVIPAELFGLAEKAKDRLCLMTNYHVMSDDAEASAVPGCPPTFIKFEGANGPLADEKIDVQEILFSSPNRGGLDCTIFKVDKPNTLVPAVEINPNILPSVQRTPTPRVYIMGYPLGKALHVSLQDNVLLDHESRNTDNPRRSNRRLVQYFAPTERGSSGSPVFDEAWRCVALHHAGSVIDARSSQSGMPRLNGKSGRHSANQGIWIKSIIDAAKT